MLRISKLTKICFGYFNPFVFTKIVKINNYPGDVSDISAQKEPMAGSSEVFFKIKLNIFLDTLILKIFL